jgi:putative ABC transport system permease protein
MNLLQLSWKNLIHKKTLSILTILAISIASALIIFILIVNKGMEEGARSGYGPYEMVVGADGSSSQLVLNTFYHFGVPIGNIPYEMYEKVLNSDLAENAFPIARGDTIKGFPIVGTDAGYLETRYPDAKIQGKLFEENGEVVIGYNAAKDLSLKVGDEFHGTHGINSEEEHEGFSYKIVGILPKLGTPDDKAVFTTAESVWLVHEDEHGETGESQSEKEHDDEEAGKDHSEEGDVTAIVVQPKGLVEAQMLKNIMNQQDGVQAAYSGKALSDILSIFDTGAQVIKIIATASILIAGISVLLSLSAMASERKKDIGLLRLLGKPKSYIFYGMLLEGNILTLIGIGIGLLAGHSITFMLKDYVFEYAGIELHSWAFIPEEMYVLLGGLLISSVASLFPAVQSYKVDPIKLFS